MGDNTKKVWKENGKWKSKEFRSEYMRQWNASHPESVYRTRRKRLDHYLDAIYAIFGEKCARCDWSDRRALQIDHKNGGGVQHLNSIRWSRTVLYKYVLEHPNEFQILCANHNWIKRHENGEGVGLGSNPHQRKENKRGPKPA